MILRAPALIAIVLLAFLVACEKPPHTKRDDVDPPNPSGASLRIASLAGRGSPWGRLLEDNARAIADSTQGRVKVTYAFGDEIEGEAEMVARMQRGELDGAMISSVGLDLLRPDVRVFEMPLLFESDADAARVRKTLAAEVSTRLDAAGMVVLTLGDPGGSYLFSREDPRDAKTVASTTWWVWENDAAMTSVLRRAGYKLDLREVPAVLDGLATGALGGCYAQLPVVIALDWKDHLRFVAGPPLSHGVAMTVVTKKAFDLLSKSDQDAVRRAAAETNERMEQHMLAMAADAMKSLEKAGIQRVELPANRLTSLRVSAEATWAEQAQSPAAKELLDKVRGAGPVRPK